MLERDSVTAYLPGWPRSAAMRAALRDEEIRQAVEVALVEQQQEVFFVGEHVLAELGAERRQPLGDRGEPRLGLGRRGPRRRG